MFLLLILESLKPYAGLVQFYMFLLAPFSGTVKGLFVESAAPHSRDLYIYTNVTSKEAA